MSVLTKVAAKAAKKAAAFGNEVVSGLKKTQHVNKVGDTKVTSIFRGKQHIGSTIQYANGATAKTSVSSSLGFTKSGDLAPAKVYKTETLMPDGTKVIGKNKLIKAGQNVEVKSSTTTKTSAARRVKQQKPMEKKTVEKSQYIVIDNPVANKIGKFLEKSAPIFDKVDTFVGKSIAIAGLSVFAGSIGIITVGTIASIFKSCSGTAPEPTAKAPEKAKVKQKQQEKKQDLIEYTPKRGENWISILKAKYGVDDVTAMAMAHKIKDMCYDDSLASKQSPVMYLPKTWNFNGKTYNYNDSTNAGRCKEFSEDVKTEMGKMSKSLKY